MMVGENIHNAFVVVFKTLQEIGWIDGPVYAVEINVDSDTCDVPKVYIAKMQFDRMKDWTTGCSPSNHSLFYNAIHGNSWTPFWGLQKLEKQEHDLTDLTQKNYKDVIFGTIEKMAK